MSERESRQDRQSQDQQNEKNESQQSRQEARQTQEQGQQGQGSRTPLQSDRGDTTIQQSVVSQVSGIAAQEVEGIRMGGDTTQRASGLLGSVTGGSGGGRNQGISVEVGREEAAVDLTLTVEYGRSAPEMADKVRRNVISRVESLTGLRVTEVNVSVSSFFFPEEEQSQQQDRDQESQQSLRSSSRVS